MIKTSVLLNFFLINWYLKHRISSYVMEISEGPENQTLS